MNQFVYYQKPVLLNKARHQGYYLKPVAGDYSFAKHTNSVLLNANEFAKMASECPIVFTANANDEVYPVVLLGSQQGENTKVDDQGNWLGRYVPAFIRQYPFVLADSTVEGRLSLCIDEKYSGLSKEAQPLAVPLFDGDDQTPALQQAVKSLSEFQQASKQTAAWVKKLQQLDLLIPLVNQGNKTNLLIVNESKLQQLDDQQVVTLFRTGELAWIHSHLISLAHMIQTPVKH